MIGCIALALIAALALGPSARRWMNAPLVEFDTTIEKLGPSSKKGRGL